MRTTPRDRDMYGPDVIRIMERRKTWRELDMYALDEILCSMERREKPRTEKANRE